MGKKRFWKRILLGFVAFVVVFATVGIPFILSVLVTRAGTRPRDLQLTTSPADYELAFEGVEFPAVDDVTIRGWYLAGNHEVAIAVGHGLFRSRREVLDRAAFFRKLGFDTLLFDFRHHGESGGERSTLGYQERLDFEGAVAYLRARAPHARVLLYGVSMGAAAALLAARDSKEVEAVIADSPFFSIEHTVVHHAKLIFGLPRFPFASALLFFLELRGGFDRDNFALEPAVRELGGRPILIVAGEEDRRMPVALQKRLFEASASPKSAFVVVAGAGHGAAYRTSPARYQTAMRSFLAGLSIKLPEASESAGERSTPSSR